MLKNPFEDQKHHKYINTLHIHSFYSSKTNIQFFYYSIIEILTLFHLLDWTHRWVKCFAWSNQLLPKREPRDRPGQDRASALCTALLSFALRSKSMTAWFDKRCGIKQIPKNSLKRCIVYQFIQENGGRSR